MTTEGDIVIVGAGPAGMATALSVARYAPELVRRLVVLDRAHFPRDKYCAGAIGGRGLKVLGELGVHYTGPRVTLDRASVRTRRGLVSVHTAGLGVVVRRKAFDAELVACARAKGIRVEEGAPIMAVEETTPHVRLDSASGELRAKWVIGADGVGSVVRRHPGFAATTVAAARAQVLEVDTPWTDAEATCQALHFDLSDHSFSGYFWDFPTLVDGAALACRGVYRIVRAAGAPRHGEALPSSTLESLLETRLRAVGLNLADYKQKRYAERGFPLRGPLATARTMLVGEAAGIDPITGEGIAQALEYGVLAGQFIAQCIRSGAPDLRRWTRTVRSARLGRDLAVRSFALAHFYGSHRQASEDLLDEHLLGTAAEYFAGRVPDYRQMLRLPWATVAGGLARTVPRALARHLRARRARP